MWPSRCVKPAHLRSDNPGNKQESQNPTPPATQPARRPEYEVANQLSKRKSLSGNCSWPRQPYNNIGEGSTPKNLAGSTRVNRNPTFRFLADGRTRTNTRQECHLITFSDDELPPEGQHHAKSLNITVLCKNLRVPLVLIDKGSGLNVSPLRTALRLGFFPASFKASHMGVRAFDNSRRNVIGEVNIDLVIWPTTLTIPLQVLDIQSSFNLVLGRPWLHDTGVVPSTSEVTCFRYY